MEILKFERFSVVIYGGVEPPHCHIRFGNSGDVIVSLPTFSTLAGNDRAITAEIREQLCENIDFICNKWDELN